MFSVFKGRFTISANFCGCASETDKLEIFFFSDIRPCFFSFADFSSLHIIVNSVCISSWSLSQNHKIIGTGRTL